jgi:dolichyl-phosphate-mannose-protein mannosyltransferase
MTSGLRITRDWMTALGFGALGFTLRLWNLSGIKGKTFDEVYYATNAHSLLLHGVELDPKTGQSEFIVHPPTGKWLIAGGIKLFGYNEFGWRFSAALVGAISIVLMYFTAKVLFNRPLLSAFAAFLVLVDGLHLVHSRTALLDIFLLLFIQIAVLTFLQKKYWFTAIALGLAVSTKWNGLYSLVALAFLVLILDYRRFKFLGSNFPLRDIVENTFILRFFQFAIIPLATYIATWAGWFASDNGWDRNWSPNPLKSFWHYHSVILNFHAHLTQSHPYEANPWSWLIQGRPTSLFYATPKTCGASSCAQEVLALGTPLLWWTATITLLITLGYWISRREWQAEILLVVIAANYLPWFAFQERTMFSFYAIAFEPFLFLTIVYVFSKIPRNQREVIVIFGAIVLANFLYFLPLYLGIPISYNSWHDHMWLPSWI